MHFIWRIVFSMTMLIAAAVLGGLAYAFYSDNKIVGFVLGLLCIAATIHAVRGPKQRHTGFTRRKKRGQSPFDNSQLDRWENAETREVTRPRDPRTKFCVDNIGKQILIRYRGTKRSIIPIRVFTKPDYKKTYVEADDSGEVKTFDIDDITLAKQ